MADNLAKATSKAIDALGGTYAVALLFDPARDPRVVSNWRRRGFPKDTRTALGPLLTAAGFDPETLFGMRSLAGPEALKRAREQASVARTGYTRKKKHNTKRR